MKWADTICCIWQKDFVLYFWMLIGTDIFGYSNGLEVLILCDFGKISQEFISLIFAGYSLYRNLLRLTAKKL